jgi:hypothetical protein
MKPICTRRRRNVNLMAQRMNRKFKVKMTLEKILVDRRVRIARA